MTINRETVGQFISEHPWIKSALKGVAVGALYFVTDTIKYSFGLDSDAIPEPDLFSSFFNQPQKSTGYYDYLTERAKMDHEERMAKINKSND